MHCSVHDCCTELLQQSLTDNERSRQAAEKRASHNVQLLFHLGRLPASSAPNAKVTVTLELGAKPYQALFTTLGETSLSASALSFRTATYDRMNNKHLSFVLKK